MLSKIQAIFRGSKQQQILRKLGFASDSEGILNRYYREDGGWNSHLQNTKEFILDSAKDKAKGTVVILGSGWLLDVPLQELASLFERVYLVDIVHSKQIKHKIAKLGNVQIVEYDISGGALEGVLNLVENKKTENSDFLDEIKLKNNNFGLSPEIKPDFVVSVNILSQLDYFALAYLRKRTTFSNESLTNFKKRIQTAHLSFLPKGKTCLITDFKENIYNDKDIVVRENLVLKVKFPDSQIQKRWKWHFDTHKSYYSDGNTYMNVLALNL